MISVAFNASSRYLLAGSQTGAIHVWDLKTQSLKRSYMVSLKLFSEFKASEATFSVKFFWKIKVKEAGIVIIPIVHH